jgi:branched-chain amino acid transport system substrate-binding protein
MRATLLAAAAFAALMAQAPAHAELPAVLRIGILNDQSGPFADASGPGSVVAARLAAEDFKREAPDLQVEILYGDHQNKADVGAAIVRSWVDRDGVAAVADAVNSAVGLAVNQIMRERDRSFVATNVATSELTGRSCAPTTVQWTMDTWANGNVAARALAGDGGDTWYFLTIDYALGTALERDTTDALHRLGARVVGSARHPLGTTDFSSLLLGAQGSGAKVVALASTGSDLINAVKQAHEFGLTPKQRLIGLLTQFTDVDGMGLAVAQGLIVSEAFYWDMNDATRAWSRRFGERMGGRMPTANQAGVYGSVLAWLRAARAADSVEGARVMAQLRSAPIDDALFGRVTVRADGRAVHAMHVFRVKRPDQSTSRYDFYEPVATVPPEQAFRPLAEGGCPLVR